MIIANQWPKSIKLNKMHGLFIEWIVDLFRAPKGAQLLLKVYNKIKSSPS